MARLEQEIGDNFDLTVTGGWTKQEVDSRTDYNLVAGNSLANNPGLLTLAATAAAPGVLFPGGVNPYVQARSALIPNGPGGGVCTSETNLNYTGIFGGFVNRCSAGSTDYDRSQSHSRQYSIEAHLDSDFEGPFNFLIGGIYLDNKFTDSNYYVASFGLDYAAGILGAATALGQRAAGNVAFPNVFLAPPTYNSEVNLFTLKSYGLFGEVYFDVTDKLRLTGGLRYSNDKKRQVARVPLLSWPVPYGITDANPRPSSASSTPTRPIAGNQPYNDRPRRLRRVHRPLRRRLQSDARQPPLRLLVARLQIGRHQPADQPDLRGAGDLRAGDHQRLRDRLEEQLRQRHDPPEPQRLLLRL